MSFADVQSKTIISTEFTSTDRAAILAAMRYIYEGSPQDPGSGGSAIIHR